MDLKSLSLSEMINMCESIHQLDLKKNIFLMIVDNILEKKFSLKNDSLLLNRFKKLSKQFQKSDFLNDLDPKSLLDISEATKNVDVKKQVYEILLKRLSEHQLILDETVQNRFNKLSNFVYDNNIYKLISDIYKKSDRKRMSNGVNSADEVCSKKLKKNNNNSSNVQNGNGISMKTLKKNLFCENYFMNDIVFLESSFKNRIVSFVINNKNNFIVCIESFLCSIKKILIKMIIKLIAQHTSVKINFIFSGDYSKLPEEACDVKTIQTRNFIFTSSTDCSEQLKEIFGVIKTKSEEFEEKGSGWSIQKILQLQINVNKYDPLCASSYIKLPEKIMLKNAVINVYNYNDQKCFKWSILSGLHYQCISRNREFVETYININCECECGRFLNFDDVLYPVDLKKITKFENINQISINVFGLENDKIIGPLHHTHNRKPTHFNLLCIGDKNSGNFHYCFIHDLSRLVSNQINDHRGKLYICDGCLLHFNSETKLQHHQNESCNGIKTILPAPNTVLEFKNWERNMKVKLLLLSIFKVF